MGCAASTEQTPEEAEKAKNKAGMRGSLVSDHSIKSHAERQNTPPGQPGTHKEEYYNAITGETTTITKSNTSSHHAPGSRLVGGYDSTEDDLANRPGQRRDSKVRFGGASDLPSSGDGERRGSDPRRIKRAWSSFIGI